MPVADQAIFGLSKVSSDFQFCILMRDFVLIGLVNMQNCPNQDKPAILIFPTE